MKTIKIVEAVPDENSDLREDELYDIPEKDVLVLNYTLACPLSCDFCCYGCHPKRTEKMPLDAAKNLVSQAAKMPNFSSVGLTGGEVFMFEKELIELAQHIHQCGLPYTVATAAHWASSPSEATRLTKKLASTGLRRANISCDPSHEAFVPKENVEFAAKALADQGIPVYIVGTFPDSEGNLEQYIPQLAGYPGISLRSKRTAKVGRATKSTIKYDDIPIDGKYCYRRFYHDIVVFWDGEVYPCCSTFNRATKNLSIGNAFKSSLYEIWMLIEYSSLLKTIKSSGYAGLLKLLEKEEPELANMFPKMDNYPGACSYCHAVFSNKTLIDSLFKFIASYETHALLSSKEELSVLLGEDVVAQLFRQSISSAT